MTRGFRAARIAICEAQKSPERWLMNRDFRGARLAVFAARESPESRRVTRKEGAAKSALTALTRSEAIEWAKFGIRANAIAPGHILTALTAVTRETPSRAQYLRERIAMQRPGTPDELVGAVVMLASEASSYMPGMMIHVGGGCLAGGAPWDCDTNY